MKPLDQRGWQGAGQPTAQVGPLIDRLGPGEFAEIQTATVQAFEHRPGIRRVAVGKRRDDQQINGMIPWNCGQVTLQQLDDRRRDIRLFTGDGDFTETFHGRPGELRQV
jgi:hypothetical protein